MNEHERAEFERHKNEAEKQLNQMYYGANKKPPKGNGNLYIPPFLTTQKHPNDAKSQNANTYNKANTKKPKSAEMPTPPTTNTPLKGGSILNFLNFKGMKMDNDRLIILAICLLLAGEEVDELLMLALMYIML